MSPQQAPEPRSEPQRASVANPLAMPNTRTRSRIGPAWRGPFRHRNYRLFWFGQLVSLAGTWMQSIPKTPKPHKYDSILNIEIIYCGYI
jgi:hypothetical protein